MIIFDIILLIFLFRLYRVNLIIRSIVIALFSILILFTIYILYILSGISEDIHNISVFISNYKFSLHFWLIQLTIYTLPIHLLLVLLIFMKIKIHSLEHFKLKNKYNRDYMKKESSKEACLRKIETLEDTPDEILLGVSSYKLPVYLKKDFIHLLLVGTTGSGKTTTLLNILDPKSDGSKVVIDGKGLTNKGSLHDYLKDSFLVFGNKSDIQNTIKYNPFKYEDTTIIVDMIMCLTVWTEEHYKLSFQTHIMTLLETMKLLNMKITLDNIIKCFNLDTFQMNLEEYSKKISATGNSEIIDDIKQCMENIQEMRLTNLIALQGLPRLKIFQKSSVISSDEDAVNMLDLLNNKSKLLIVLDSLAKQELSNQLGKLLVVDYRSAFSLTSNTDHKDFICDEAGVYIDYNIINILDKSRSAKVSVIIGLQSLAYIDNVDSNLTRGIIENCNNHIVMLQNEQESVEALSSLFGTKTTAKKTFQQDGLSENAEKGSVRETEEYVLHPNDIKQFKVGEGAVLMKGTNYQAYNKVYFKQRKLN